LGIHLREWTDEDLPALVELFDDPYFYQWTPLASPFDLSAAQTYLSRARDQRNAGRVVQLAITTDGQTPMGEVLLVRREEDGRHAAELAYGVGAKYRRQRLATRAVELMTRYAHEASAFDRVILRIAPGNTASEAVARASGFHLTDENPSFENVPTAEACACAHGPTGRARRASHSAEAPGRGRIHAVTCEIAFAASMRPGRLRRLGSHASWGIAALDGRDWSQAWRDTVRSSSRAGETAGDG
jgi:RimJ/RimL family protein N-acetyltransferase